MKDSSNPPPDPSLSAENLEYLFASNVNVSNFVSVKLCGNHNYHVWSTQMLYLMKCHDMVGLVDLKIKGPRVSKQSMMDKYDSLLKGWIFGSVSEDLLIRVIDLKSVKEVWGKLESICDPTMSSQIDPVPRNANATTPNRDIMCRNKKLFRATIKGDWWEAETILRHDRNAIRDIMNDGGETIVHIAVGTSHKYFVKKLLDFIEDTEILKSRSLDGSTALHFAAMTGNTYAADLLIQRMESLIETRNHAGHLPYVAAYLNHQLDASVFLLKATFKNKQSVLPSSSQDSIEHKLLFDFISTKRYDLALELFSAIPNLAVEDNVEVLMAIAKNFPSGLNRIETMMYPSLGGLRERMVEKSSWSLFTSVVFFNSGATTKHVNSVLSMILLILNGLIAMPILLSRLINFLIWIGSLSFYMFYFLLWEVAEGVVPSLRHITKRMKQVENASKILKMVCEKIDKSEPTGSGHSLYRRPILEAACQNAYEVVAEILSRAPEAITWVDESGFDIFHLAIMHRSEKIYNLIYQNMDRRSLCRTCISSSGDNILHLAGRVAPPHKRARNAALQLQQALQLCEELKELVVPTLMYQKNIFEETPDMVFTKEHEELVKEAEKWMKTTAESCSIIAALIATIGFAAAITVPRGSNQETGIPLYKKDTAFSIFAVSDAISLCASTTSLLMYLSILTGTWAQQDFLYKLPGQLVVCLCSLLVSTGAMLVAFGATLFLVLSRENPWMLAPICGLIIPIPISIMLPFSLIVDFFKSYGLPIFFIKKRNSRRIGLF